MSGRQKTKKKTPKIHTKQFEIHVVEGDDKLLVEPSDEKEYMHFKRWCYQNLPKRALFWDNTAKLYVIDLYKTEVTSSGESILKALKREFTVLDYLPFEE